MATSQDSQIACQRYWESFTNGQREEARRLCLEAILKAFPYGVDPTLFEKVCKDVLRRETA